LIEHRIASDAKAPPCLVRLSVGVEDIADLKDDLRQAFQAVVNSDEREVAEVVTAVDAAAQ
jgi:cystathionine gamma-synthase